METIRIVKMIEDLNELYDIRNVEVLDDTTLIIDGDKYMVLTNSEATEMCGEVVRDGYDSEGLNYFSEYFQDHILRTYVDTEWFDEQFRQLNVIYCEDIKHEVSSNGEFDNRLEEEIHNCDCETIEEYIDYLCEEDSLEHYIDNFGKSYTFKLIMDYDLIVDFDKLIEDVIDDCGRGELLASYDGDERWLGSDGYGTVYYAYMVC